jgi:hypothetical protein
VLTWSGLRLVRCSQAPTNPAFRHSMLMMVLGRKRIGVHRNNAFEATHARIDPRVWGCNARFMDRIESYIAALLKILHVFIENHFLATFLPLRGPLCRHTSARAPR